MKRDWKPRSPWLGRRVKQGFRGYPAATIAFYGPTAELATKVVVGIFKEEHCDADPLEKWFSENSDIRSNDDIGEELVAFIKSHAVKSVIVTDGIIGGVPILGWPRPLDEGKNPVGGSGKHRFNWRT